MKKIIILFIVAILIVVGVVMIQSPSQEEQEGPKEVIQQEVLSFLEALVVNSATQTADLVAVDESDSKGTGYRLVQDGNLSHVVVAIMPDPAEGNVYEGWLMQKEPLQFFSTGILEKNEQGIWQLEYTDEQEYPTYLRVVITEETVVDETPEVHIIEGDFPETIMELQIEDIVSIIKLVYFKNKQGKRKES